MARLNVSYDNHRSNSNAGQMNQTETLHLARMDLTSLAQEEGLKTTSGELKSLTALRGIAAMAVVLQHFSSTAQEHCLVWIPSIIPHGYVAVDFFFVLSGFIMSYTYLASFKRQGLAAYSSFILKRIARIAPLNVVILLVLSSVAWLSLNLVNTNPFFQTDSPIYDLICNLLMLQGLGLGTNLNGPSWSISTEFAAYLLFPAFIVAVFGRHVVLWSSVGLAIVGLFWIALSQPRLGLSSEGPPGSLVRCFAEFTLGMAAYRLFRHERVAAYLRTDLVTIVLSLLAAGLLIARYDLPAVLLFPLIVVAYAGNTGLAGSVISARPFYFLGVVSFSLYLLHGPFRPLELSLLRVLSPDKVGPIAALTFAFLGACSIIPLAWLAYIGVERPGRALVRSLFERPVSSVAPSEAKGPAA